MEVNWGRLGVMDYIGFGEYLDAEHFSVLLVKGDEVRINKD